MKYLSYFLRYCFINPFSLKKIEKIIDIDSFDIIHTNTVTVNIGAKLAKKHGINHIWHLREFGKEDMNFIPFSPKCYKKINSDGGRFIAISDVIKNTWVKKGISPDKITRIYDGVKTGGFLKKEACFEGKKIKIAFCGSVNEFKGQERMIEAFNIMPVEKRKLFCVDIWGSGKKEYVDFLKEKISQYGLGDVIFFKGYTDDLYRKLSEYDVGMNCSNSEAFGRVTVEYMLAGLLAAVSDTGANPELIQNGKYGVLFNKDDPEDICNKLIWISENKDKAASVSEKARIYAEESFSIENNSRRFIEYYKTVCKQ
ncbi:MAG: glycosyltransferase family 4 protein [Eubacterium sp.]|nr:glycosyltransferase family 4 protein [Eubacterium sp.]